MLVGCLALRHRFLQRRRDLDRHCSLPTLGGEELRLALQLAGSVEQGTGENLSVQGTDSEGLANRPVGAFHNAETLSCLYRDGMGQPSRGAERVRAKKHLRNSKPARSQHIQASVLGSRMLAGLPTGSVLTRFQYIRYTISNNNPDFFKL